MPTLADAIRTPPMTCPYCGKRIDAASMYAERKGEKVSLTPNRDVSLCSWCGEWIFLNQAGTGWRKPTDREFEAIVADKRCRLLRDAWLMNGGSFDRPRGFGSDVTRLRPRR